MSKRRVALYARISVERIEGESVSPERQLYLCRQLAEQKGWEVVGEYVDRGKSGWKNVERPQFDAMLRAVEAGKADAIMAYSLSRLGRRARKLLDLVEFLQEHGATLALYDQQVDTSTGQGRFFLGIVAGFAELEAEETSKKVRSAHKVAVEQGKMHGGGSRQFGWARDSKTRKYIGVDPEESAVVREIASRVLAGESLRRLADELNARGIRTGAGKQWTGQTLGQMLRSLRLSARRRHEVWEGRGDKRRLVSDTVHDGAWEPILSPEDHDRLLAALSRPPGRRAVVRHLLTGLAYCSCGGQLKALKFRQSNGKMFERYQCVREPGSRVNNCGKVAASKAGVERVVLDRLFAILSSSELRPVDDGRRAELEEQVRADEEALVELTRARFVDRSLTEAEFRPARDNLRQRIEQAQGELAALDRAAAVAAEALRPGSREELEAWWEAASIEEQRAALRAAIRRITVRPAAHRGGNRFQEDRVVVEWSWALYARIGKKGTPDWSEAEWAEAEAEHYRLAAEAEGA